MKRIMIIILLTFSLFSTACAEKFLLPTPPPSEATSAIVPEAIMPNDSDKKAKPVRDLPDPSYQLRTVGEIHENYFTMDEKVMDARIYPIYGISDAISEYLTACTDAGYNWELSDIFSGYLAYRIFGGGNNAYFIPNYGEKTLLLIQQGMPVQNMMDTPEPYEQNKLLVNINGTTIQMDFLKEYIVDDPGMDTVNILKPYQSYKRNNQLVFYSSNAPYRLICVAFPTSVQTGKTYTLNRTDQEDTGFILYKNFVETPNILYLGSPTLSEATVFFWGKYWNSPNAMIFNGHKEKLTVGLSSDSDYLNLQLIYVNGNDYRGRFEGVLCDGSLTLSGTFWAVK